MLDLVQGSEAWIQCRLGKVTASRVADVVATVRSGGYGASRASYMAELIAERLTGQPAEKFTNAAMAHGTATEPEARSAYEFHANCDVQQVGFVPHPSISASGASPDGMVGSAGLLEIKAPTPSVHIETLLSENIPDRYVKQMQFQLACTDREWVDYCSYDPRMSAPMRLFIRRVYRDNQQIKTLEAEVELFLAELDQRLAALRAKFGESNALAAWPLEAALSLPMGSRRPR